MDAKELRARFQELGIKKVKVGGEVNSLGKTRNVKVAGDDTLDMMTKGMMAARFSPASRTNVAAIRLGLTAIESMAAVTGSLQACPRPC